MLLRKCKLVLVLVLFSFASTAQEKEKEKGTDKNKKENQDKEPKEDEKTAEAGSTAKNLNELILALHEEKIDSGLAARKFSNYIRHYLPGHGFAIKEVRFTHFPIANYSSKNIGGSVGNGYKPKGYYFFEGNKHKGHPAHDIFIYDKNQDYIDDKTKKPAELVAVCDGIVIAVNKGWKAGSKMRSGNYIYLYNSTMNIILYYAHCDKVFVEPGQKIQGGMVIGTVGRSGINAAERRSPTHLHFSSFKIINGSPVPFNSFKELVQAGKK